MTIGVASPVGALQKRGLVRGVLDCAVQHPPLGPQSVSLPSATRLGSGWRSQALDSKPEGAMNLDGKPLRGRHNPTKQVRDVTNKAPSIQRSSIHSIRPEG